MEQKQNPNELSGQIQRSVEAAVNSINHMVSDIKNTPGSTVTPLGEEVNQSVKSAVEEIKTQFYAAFQGTQEVNRRQAGITMDPARYSRYAEQQQAKTQYQQRFRMENPRQVAPVRVRKKAKKFPGEEAAEGATTALGIGSGILGLITIGCLTDGEGFGVSLFFILAFLACLAGLVTNVRKKRRYKRFREYINRFSSQPSYSVMDIMTTFGYSRKTVISDWQEMIRLGIFPQANISPDEQMIFLSNAAFMQYQSQMMSSMVGPSAAAFPQTSQRTAEPASEVRKQEATPAEKTELQKTLEQGRAYINQIRSANDAIPGEIVSQKLDTLEDVCKRIFSVVEAHPEKRGEIRKFMDYYMPTTLKLVRTYREFDEQKLEGEQIAQTKQDIEGTLDMINIAFANLLNDMYQDQAVEASADISVLSALFAQAGLKDSEFTMQSAPQPEKSADPFADSANIELKL